MSHSALNCRQTDANDLPSMYLLLEQRLIHVDYHLPSVDNDNDTDRDRERDVKGRNSVKALFESRREMNMDYLRHQWGMAVDSLHSLHDSSALSLVLHDREHSLVAWASFGVSPLSCPLEKERGFEHQWPRWVNERSSFVFNTGKTYFLTFFACISLEHAKQEKQCVELFMKTAFTLLPAAEAIICVPVAASAGEKLRAPLDLLYHRVDIDTEKESGTDFDEKQEATERFSVYACRRAQLFPTLSIRRARLEDHDDLVPIFSTGSHRMQQLEPYYLAKVIEPRLDATLVEDPKRSTYIQNDSPPKPSLARSLSFPHSSSSIAHPLVGEHDGRAVGLMNISNEVDLVHLSKLFDLSCFGIPAPLKVEKQKNVKRETFAPFRNEFKQEVNEEYYQYAAGISAYSPRLSLSDNQNTLVGAALCLQHEQALKSCFEFVCSGFEPIFSEFHDMAELVIEREWLVEQLASFICKECDSSPELASSSTILIKAIALKAQAGIEASRAIFENHFYELVSDTVLTVHNAKSPITPSKQPSHSELVSRSLLVLLEHLANAAERDLNISLPPNSESLSFPEDRQPKAFIINLFCISKELMERSEDFLLPAFALFEDCDLCLTTIPYSTQPPPLLQHFTLVPACAHVESGELVDTQDLQQALYAIHRHTAVALKQNAISVRYATEGDLPGARELFSDESVGEAFAQAILPSALNMKPMESFDSLRKQRHIAFAIDCAGETVGLIQLDRLKDEAQVKALNDEFEVSTVCQCRQPQSQAFINTFMLNFLFHSFLDYVLAECLRLSCSDALLFRAEEVLPALEEEPLSTMTFYHHLRQKRSRTEIRRKQSKRIPRMKGVSASDSRILQHVMRGIKPLTPPHPPLELPVSAALQATQVNDQSELNSQAGLVIEGADSSHIDANNNEELTPPGPVAAMPPSCYLRTQLMKKELRRSYTGAEKGTDYARLARPYLQFSLYMCTTSTLSRLLPCRNDRLVVVGCSSTAVACLEGLLFNPHVLFSSITLIAPMGLHAAHESEMGGPFLRCTLQDTLCQLRKLGMTSRLKIVCDHVISIEQAENSPDSPANLLVLAKHPSILFDHLIVATGRAPTLKSWPVYSVPEENSVYRRCFPQQDHQEQKEAIGPIHNHSSDTLVFDSQAASISLDKQLLQLPKPAFTVPQDDSLALRTYPVVPVLSVQGLHCLSNAEHIPSIVDQWNKRSLTATAPGTPQSYVVFGATMTALTAIRGLLEMGVVAHSITWAHPLIHQPPLQPQHALQYDKEKIYQDELSQAVCHGDMPFMLKMVQVLTKLNIRILHHVHITHFTSYPYHTYTADNETEWKEKEKKFSSSSHMLSFESTKTHVLCSVTFSNGETLPCSAFLQCHAGEIDSRILKSLSKLGLVFDGDLVVDSHFRTHKPEIRSAGPMARFRKTFVDQIPSLRHAHYSSTQVGHLLAKQIVREFSFDSSPKEGHLLFSLVEAPTVESAFVPGDLYYFHAREVNMMLPKKIDPALVIEQSTQQFTFSITLSPHLSISSITYYGPHLIPAHNFYRLISLPVTYLNRLLQKWKQQSIRSLPLFLSQHWAQTYYHPRFKQFHSQLLHSLHSPHAAQLSSLLNKMKATQKQISVDNGSKNADNISLFSLGNYLPQHIKSEAKKKLHEFVDEQKHQLIALQSAQPFFTGDEAAMGLKTKRVT